MFRIISIRRSSGSLVTTIPKQMAQRLHLGPGDRVLAVEVEKGILLMTPEPAAAEGLAVAESAANKFRNALGALAK